MAISDRILSGLRSVFGRERDERMAAPSPSTDAVVAGTAAPSSYASYNANEVGGLLTVSQNLMSRYADYECLTGDTQVLTLGGAVKISVLAECCQDENFRFYVYTWDGQKITVGEAENARKVKKEVVYRLALDDGQVFRATGNHLWMRRDGEYAQTTDLKPGDSLMPLYLSRDKAGYVFYRENESWHKGALTSKDSLRTRPVSRMVAEWLTGERLEPNTWALIEDGDKENLVPSNIDVKVGARTPRSRTWEPIIKSVIRARNFVAEHANLTGKNNHKVVSIDLLEEEDVYCLEVPGTHNYAIGSKDGGVFCHNSMDDYPDINCFAEGSLVSIIEGSVVKGVPIEDLLSGSHSNILAYDRGKERLVSVPAVNPRLTGKDAEVVALKLSNGRTLRVTPDHKILASFGYTNASNLRAGDKIVSLTAGLDCSQVSMFTNPLSNIVTLVEDPKPDGKVDVYDITTSTHNLMVEGVVCHNSANHYYASDSTQPNTDNGRVIWVNSNDDALKAQADTLMRRRLRLDDEMFSMAYTLVKYGNDFEELLVTENGVVGMNYLPPATMRRIDHRNGALIGFLQDSTGTFSESMTEIQASLANKQAHNQKVALFEDWQVVHMRLRSRHRRSPYGYGVADGARWIWKRLVMLEDSMMIYKLTRAPARFAFYIDVTDIPANRVESFLQRAKRDLKKNKFVDPNTGKLNMRYNPLANDEDFFLPVRDGKELARVDILSGPDYQAIDDVQYFQKKLHGVLKVPRSWLGQDEGIPSRSILSNEDVRTARVTLGIQSVMRHGIERLLRVDMAARGVTNPWQPDLDVVMTMPSGIYALAAMEVKNAQADYASRLEPYVSRDWIRTNIFKMSEKEIEVIDKQKKREREMEQAAQGGGMGSFGASSDAKDNILEDVRASREYKKMVEGQKRLEGRRDRTSRERHDELLDKLDGLLVKDSSFAQRHRERVGFFNDLKKSAVTNKNGFSVGVPSAE